MFAQVKRIGADTEKREKEGEMMMNVGYHAGIPLRKDGRGKLAIKRARRENICTQKFWAVQCSA